MRKPGSLYSVNTQPQGEKTNLLSEDVKAGVTTDGATDFCLKQLFSGGFITYYIESTVQRNHTQTKLKLNILMHSVTEMCLVVMC